MLKSEIFVPLEIEIQLVPGLPTIQFLGLPSPGLKESAMRIRTALRSAGFQMPKGRQILVDVRPREEKKHGRGVDLAVALGYLRLTDQIRRIHGEDSCYYGDLSLSAEVSAPIDWRRARVLQNGEIVTGVGPEDGKFRGGRAGEGLYVVRHLRDLMGEAEGMSHLRPEGMVAVNEEIEESEICFEADQAELVMLAASGGHSILLAGPQGTGKSTLARMIHQLRPRPSIDEMCEIETWSGEPRRPLVEPHHTASELAMVGGRQPPRPGAITRAHLGTLLLDEVLLFRPEVQEALREPLETGVVHLARGPDSRKFPADFQLIGTTNLCECGKYTPYAEDQCQCPSRVRSKFDGRLRGPFVDRFQLLAYTDRWRPAAGHVTVQEMRKRVSLATEFQRSLGRNFGNRRWRPQGMTDRELRLFRDLPRDGSERRRLSIQRVARTFADLEMRDEICDVDIFKARAWALSSFVALVQRVSGSLPSL